METDQCVDEQLVKKGRQRKKLLFHSIKNQMEFYFSDSNLAKDRYINQLLQESPGKFLRGIKRSNIMTSSHSRKFISLTC